MLVSSLLRLLVEGWPCETYLIEAVLTDADLGVVAGHRCAAYLVERPQGDLRGHYAQRRGYGLSQDKGP